jgi:dienelactone hydrolase
MRHFFIPVAVLLASSLITAQESFDAVAAARRTLDLLTRGEFAAVVAMFDDTVRAAMPEDKLRATWAGVESQFGKLKHQGEPQLSRKGAFQVVVIPTQFERATADIQFAFDGSGRMAGLNIRPPTSAAPFTDASYVTASAFTERDVTVDAGGWPLPATLTMPNSPTPVAAIVLVHGSGPNDRDESLGPNRVFRDLARGLASRGIAVLRYEKRTRQHGPKIAGLTSFTVKEETVDDAVAAARLLKTMPGVNPKRVFALGHSLGGMLAPRIAAAAGADLAGVIMMAGAVRSLEQSLIDQTRYLAQADGTISPDEQKQIAQFEQLAARVATLRPGDAPPVVPGISAPTSYWIDLRGYDPPVAARDIRMPMLILQGGRDYQVTTGDFERWKAALGGRRDVTLKLYPALNHLFIAGQGPSLPAEYLSPGHVDEQVVRDIAEWVQSM